MHVLTVADFLATHRGGGLFTEAVNQRIGARIALAGYRLGASPTGLTLANLALGVGASVALAGLAGRSAAGALPAWLAGLVALLGWQLAYSFDCADGQLARVTGRASAAGARLDVLCDVAVQIAVVTAIAVTATAHAPGTPSWLVAVFAGTWMVNLVTSVLAAGPAAGSLLASGSTVVRVVKLVRDYGAVLTACGAVLIVRPAWTPWLMAALSVVNGGFLAASIARTAGGPGLRRPTSP